MLNAKQYLNLLQERGEQGKPINRVMRGMRNPGLFMMAYMNLYGNKGSMTEDTQPEDTMDGMSQEWIAKTIKLLANREYYWKPVRSTYIPKKNGKRRPLEIPDWTPKVIQEVMRLILNTYYEPQFSDLSHGFRPKRGCHTALRQVTTTWKGTKWFIEGDIKGCFGNIDHETLLALVGEKVEDEGFIQFLRAMLKAGYIDKWKYFETYSGAPQGGIISPLLSNIYLDKLDQYVEKVLIPEYTRGDKRQVNPEYERTQNRIQDLERKDNLTEQEKAKIKALRKKLRTLPYGDPNDEHYRRLRYVRYADDFLLGYTGTKAEAKEIKRKLIEFMAEPLKLELSQEKTKITHATTGQARFLGYDIFMAKADHKLHKARRPVNGQPQLAAPPEVIHEMVKQVSRQGKPHQRDEMVGYSDYQIVRSYEAQLQGTINYYTLAVNVSWFYEVQRFWKDSLYKTLMVKHKITRKKAYKKYRYVDESGKVGIKAMLPREGKPPLTATFGLKRIKYHPKASLRDQKPLNEVYTKRAELAQGLKPNEVRTLWE